MGGKYSEFFIVVGMLYLTGCRFQQLFSFLVFLDEKSV